MISYPFNYRRAQSVADAVAMLASASDGKLLAGGQTLIAAMKMRLANPSDLIDISTIKELAGIRVGADAVVIGAATTHFEVASSAAIAKAIPALAHLASLIGDPAVRHKGTLGGSVANNDPAADYPAAVLGLGATIKTDKRTIAADDYFQGMFTTALETSEIITEISFPVPAKAAYKKFANPASRYAMAGAFVAKLKDGSVRAAPSRESARRARRRGVRGFGLGRLHRRRGDRGSRRGDAGRQGAQSRIRRQRRDGLVGRSGLRRPHRNLRRSDPMKSATLAAINDARRAGRAIVRATDLETGDDMLIDPATDASPLGIAAAGAARADTSGPAQIEGRSWFLSVYNPPLELVIVGAVHIAQPLVAMAHEAGYRVRMIDPRTAFATPARFPSVAISHDWPDEALAKRPLGPRSAVVFLSHDPKIDDPGLIAALKSDCFYIGTLGSKKTQAARNARMKAAGFDDATLAARIHGPIGLDIGARTPAEIAISILAEMTLVLRGRKGG